MLCDLPFVKSYRNRHGKIYYYLRKRGCKPVRLTGKPGTAEFVASYHAALDAVKPAPVMTGVVPGSFEALCRQYLQSSDYSQLSNSWKREMGYVINSLRSQIGPYAVKDIQRRHVVGWKDDLRAKPGAANKMLRTLRILLAYAIAREYRNDNPTTGVKLMKLGRYRSWTNAELQQFRAKWTVGTLERAVFDLALYTGQRRGDLAAFRRDQIQSGFLTFTQHKTRREMSLRIHAELQRSLDAFMPTHKALTIIAGKSGGSLNPVSMAAIFRDAVRDAGLPKECRLHGLRKSAARILAEIGKKSSPVTGHATRAMQDEYERDANQRRMGDDAIRAWERAEQKATVSTLKKR